VCVRSARIIGTHRATLTKRRSAEAQATTLGDNAERRYAASDAGARQSHARDARARDARARDARARDARAALRVRLLDGTHALLEPLVRIWQGRPRSIVALVRCGGRALPLFKRQPNLRRAACGTDRTRAAG
jgi:hypothetical protein